MKLEYLIIFESSGIPILSHCFSGFCKNLGVNETLLSGFLSALSSLPTMFGETIKSVEMGSTKLFFGYAEPNKQIICAGVNKVSIDTKTQYKVELMFNEISKLINNEFKAINWNRAFRKERMTFRHHVIESVLIPVLQDEYYDECEKGDHCPFNIDRRNENIISEDSQDHLKIWERIKINFNPQKR